MNKRAYRIGCIFLAAAIFLLTIGVANATPPARPDEVLWSSICSQAGNPACGSVTETPYGGYVIAGEYSYAVGVDANGRELWSNSYAEDGYGRFCKAIRTLDDSYMFAGNKSYGWNGTTGDAFIAKAGLWDSARNDSGRAGYAPLKIFTKTYNVPGCESWLKDGLQEADGTFIFAGTAENVSGGDRSVPGSGFIYVLKTDADGNLLWSNLYRGNGSSAGNGITWSPDGGYAIAGTVYDNGSGDQCAYLLRIDGSGNKLWDATYPGAGTASAFSICNAGDDGYVLAGRTLLANSTSGYHANASDFIIRSVVYLVRVSQNGSELWNRTFDATGTANDVIPSYDGGFVLVGTANIPGCNGNGYIAKVDSDGDLEWDRNVGGTGDGLTSVVQATNDSYVCGGYVDSGDSRRSMWLIDIGMTKGPGYTPGICCCWSAIVFPALAISLVAIGRRRMGR